MLALHALLEKNFWRAQLKSSTSKAFPSFRKMVLKYRFRGTHVKCAKASVYTQKGVDHDEAKDACHCPMIDLSNPLAALHG